MIAHDIIPTDKQLQVAEALRRAFATTKIEDLQPITKGNTSALVLRIVVNRNPYLLKIVTKPYTMVDPNRRYICMKLAADAGLAPKVHYASAEAGISIIDFIEEVPLLPTDALIRIPRMLRSLHALSPFPPETQANTTCTYLLNKGPALDGFLAKFKETSILSPSDTEQLLAWLDQISAVYSRDRYELVSSHNDLFKPDNILFDGCQLWLVDWEAAFQNDRYADLAAAAQLVITSDADEQLYLQEYFGAPPTEYQRARFFLMRQLTHIFYTIAFLYTAKPQYSHTEPSGDLQALTRLMWAGQLDLRDPATKIAYGMAHWDQCENHLKSACFADALRILTVTR